MRVTFWALFLCSFSAFSQDFRLTSPDGRIALDVHHRQVSPGKRRLSYEMRYRDRPVVRQSDLSIAIDNHVFEEAMAHKVTSPPGTKGKFWCDNLLVTGQETLSKDTTWKPVYGERSLVRDQYNQLIVHLKKEDDPNYRLDVVFRAYNAGVAFHYFFPEHPQGMYYRVMAENSEFALPEGTNAWFTGWAQGKYARLPLKDWPDESERPLTLELPGGLYAALGEAGLADYAMTKFRLQPEKPNTLVTSMYESADLTSPVGTPWRVVMVGERLGTLLENNDIFLNLNRPSVVSETAWIKPGKIIREVTLTTEGARACIDFAAAHGLQYILFDWKWYGPAFSFDSDARKVVAPMDLPAIIEYGNRKGIGVWLYVNQQALQAQLDDILPLYKKWGVKGLKFGFVQVGSHRWTTWLADAMRKAAENGLMVNVHDEYRPTGLSRTYPNVLTQEGIRGNEEFPDAAHNTVLPFTRYLCGAGDYTICYYDRRLKTTHAHQLAMNVISYSPLQSVFWYDKPAQYAGEPEIEFFEKVPTVWDDTRVIHDRIGEYVTLARRSGEEWFVGSISGNGASTFRLPLSFLSDGKKYILTTYADDATVSTRTKVKVERRSVTSRTVLDVSLLPSGGQAWWLAPEK
jgi:alpha-glucosidase